MARWRIRVVSLIAVALLGLPISAAGADRITLVGDQARTISSDTTITGPSILVVDEYRIGAQPPWRAKG